MKRCLKSVLRGAVCSRLAALTSSMLDDRPNILRVLTYHRIGDPADTPGLNPNTLSATPAAFSRQMELLASNFAVTSVDEVLTAFNGQRILPPRSVLITFDDAYCDFNSHAWPILRRMGLPVVLFVATAYPDQPQRVFWWDALYGAVHQSPRRAVLNTPLGPLPIRTPAQRCHSLKQLVHQFQSSPAHQAAELVKHVVEASGANSRNQVMGWNTLRGLVREGLSVGVHTQTHPLLNRLEPAGVRREIRSAYEDLRTHLGHVRPVFAYPGGAFNRQTVTILRQEGFQLAFTTCRGANEIRTADPLRLRRINVGRTTTDGVLKTQLALPPKWFNSFCPLKSAS